MKKILKQVFIYTLSVISLLTLTIFSFAITGFASEGSSDENVDVATATGFTYKVEFPENQTKDDLGYFDLMVTPGQKQTLIITLSNPGKEALTVNVSYNGAKTNSNGVIEYGDSLMENDASLMFDFKELVTGVDKVELNAGETKNLEIQVAMPETSYKGVLAGGIQLKQANQGGDQEKSQGSQVINEYAYVIGLLLKESDEVLAPELVFNRAYGAQQNYKNTIMVNFSNTIATYINGMTVEAQIMEKGKQNVLYDRKQTDMRMAPNTYIDFPISMNGEQMVPGEYTTHVLVTAEGKSWEWTEDFEITAEEAEKYNERDAGLVQDRGVDWKLIAMIVGGFLFIVLVIVLIVHFAKNGKKKKTKEKTDKKRKNSKNTTKKKEKV